MSSYISTIMAKAIKTIIKLQLPAGAATPAPPVGTALGPHGLNIGEFVSKFNEQTRAQAGSIVPAEITIYEDRTFTFKLKTSPASDMLRKAAKVGRAREPRIRIRSEKSLARTSERSPRRKWLT